MNESNSNKDEFKSKELNVGNQISMHPGGWSFNKDIVDSFDNHIQRSVPHYADCHKLAVNVSEYFLENESIVIDLGSTTGTFIKKLCEHHKNKKTLDIRAIEIEEHFCDYMKKIFEKSKLNDFHTINIINEDIENVVLEKQSVDLFTSFFTLQFNKPNKRFKILKKIYESLNWGGGFILFEKVRGVDARFQDILNYLLSINKLENNFTPNEIFAKSLSLAGRMEPFSDFGNRQILSEAGFKDIEIIFRYINFQGYICIK